MLNWISGWGTQYASFKLVVRMCVETVFECIDLLQQIRYYLHRPPTHWWVNPLEKLTAFYTWILKYKTFDILSKPITQNRERVHYRQHKIVNVFIIDNTKSMKTNLILLALKEMSSWVFTSPRRPFDATQRVWICGSSLIYRATRLFAIGRNTVTAIHLCHATRTH